MFSKSTIKYIQSLQQKKFRDESGVFVAEGPKLVTELLEGRRFPCSNIYALQDWAEQNEQLLTRHKPGAVDIVKDFELQKLASYTTANKVVAVFQKSVQSKEIDPAGQITIVLDGIQDPGNLGTIIRSADWFGVKNIVCSGNTVDVYNPKVVQSTMASLGRVDVYYRNLDEWLSSLPGIKKYAATLEGEAVSGLTKIDEAILIIGNESQGISKEILALADMHVTIPRLGKAESLNAGVATSILLYAIRS